MTETEYKRKLKRLEWLMDRAEEHQTKVYDNDIEKLSDEIHEYEEREYPIPPPSPEGLLQYHLDRTGLKKRKMAGRMEISSGYFSKILAGQATLSEKMKDYILNFNYKLL